MPRYGKIAHHGHVPSVHAKDNTILCNVFIITHLSGGFNTCTNTHYVRANTHKYARRNKVANKTAPSLLNARSQSKEARMAGLVKTMEHTLHLMSDHAGRYQAGCQTPPTG